MRVLVRIFSWMYRVVALRLLPLIILLAIGWSGYQVAEAVTRQVNEQSDYQAHIDGIDSTATALVGNSLISMVIATDSPTDVPTELVTETPVPTDTSVPTDVLVSPTVEEPTEQPLPTNTEISTNTVVPDTSTPTDEPTSEPTLTDIPTDVPTEVSESTQVSNDARPQQFVTNTPLLTNTPRPVVFATNTPAGGNANPTIEADSSTLIEPTIIPTQIPTVATATATSVPTFTPTEVPPTPLPQATNPPVPTVFFPQSPQEGTVLNGTLVPTESPLIQRDYDLVNILILGGDDGLTNDGFNRTDSMIVVSINRDTGTVGLLHLPRDLFVYLPSGQMQRLNVAYAVGENIGWTDGGFGLIRQTILYNFGINVHYHVRLDFGNFQEIIDNFGGVNIANDCEYQDYALIGAEVPEGAIAIDDEGLWSLPVGYYEMSGAEALWYARSRTNSSDFDRGRRQIQIIRALWRQIRASGQLSLTNLPSLWDQGVDLVETDLNLETMISLLPFALDLDLNTLQSYQLIHTYHTTPWQTPAGDFVQLPVYDTLQPLLQDFYQPPPESLLLIQDSTIAVFNGSGNENWDLVASDRLGWEGFNAIAYGEAETTDYTDTVLIDRTGETRGGSLNQIADLLNVRSENIIIDPDPNRTSDYEVIIGSNYHSCDGTVVDISEN